jgi:deoxyribonuclease V
LKITPLIHEQITLAKRVKINGIQRSVNYIAGVDVAVSHDRLFGCICVFSFPKLALVDYSCAAKINVLPYIPGLLSYREVPVIMKAFNTLKKIPHLILVDGQGIAHPRYIGFASHLGVLLNIPTIGCAKSHLFGDYQMPGAKKGMYTLLTSGQKKLGIVFRTRDNTRPLFVSPGHLVNLNDCRRFVLSATTKYRIPEPIRCAHKMAGEKARQYE